MDNVRDYGGGSVVSPLILLYGVVVVYMRSNAWCGAMDHVEYPQETSGFFNMMARKVGYSSRKSCFP